jgi:hypothetical protein
VSRISLESEHRHGENQLEGRGVPEAGGHVDRRCEARERVDSYDAGVHEMPQERLETAMDL